MESIYKQKMRFFPDTMRGLLRNYTVMYFSRHRGKRTCRWSLSAGIEQYSIVLQTHRRISEKAHLVLQIA